MSIGKSKSKVVRTFDELFEFIGGEDVEYCFKKNDRKRCYVLIIILNVKIKCFSYVLLAILS